MDEQCSDAETLQHRTDERAPTADRRACVAFDDASDDLLAPDWNVGNQVCVTGAEKPTAGTRNEAVENDARVSHRQDGIADGTFFSEAKPHEVLRRDRRLHAVASEACGDFAALPLPDCGDGRDPSWIEPGGHTAEISATICLARAISSSVKPASRRISSATG